MRPDKLFNLTLQSKRKNIHSREVRKKILFFSFAETLLQFKYKYAFVHFQLKLKHVFLSTVLSIPDVKTETEPTYFGCQQPLRHLPDVGLLLPIGRRPLLLPRGVCLLLLFLALTVQLSRPRVPPFGSQAVGIHLRVVGGKLGGVPVAVCGPQAATVSSTT